MLPYLLNNEDGQLLAMIMLPKANKAAVRAVLRERKLSRGCSVSIVQNGLVFTVTCEARDGRLMFWQFVPTA